ncbi:multifunctional CCA addition/repair protein [Corallincola holothuriorum]|uniref:Multifunctional CCA protein n=1 Tax=Corallincola holothuriorum TaxID=2282215 RepID=A0A368NQH1_9GAMM|nr:multifunctional CCA addition/repair protein [Corallincola holothuriorum]RCU51729.1 multifunctional CCA addition/repair protein [Corallincola holothuriorum]
MQIYLVGGAVRDRLLQIPVQDKDFVVVGSSSTEMLAAGYQAVGADFPVFLHPTTKQEYALARTERKSGHGYTGFICHASPEVTLEEDLLRRDLTINAIAEAEDGSLIDPYGGQEDLQNRLLRHVSPAFAEDPLRVLRVARFAARYAALGFTVADETMILMQKMAANGELAHLVAERIWKETERALMGPNPACYFEILREAGALQCLMPAVAALWGVPNPPKWHPEIDTGIHTMMVLEQAALANRSLEVRYAALCHDLGKGLTPPDQWPSHRGHEKTGLALVTELSQALKVPTACRELALLVCEYHTHCHKADTLRPKTLLKVLDAMDVWRKPERFEYFLQACEADFKGRTEFEHRPYPQAGLFRQAHQAALSVNPGEIARQGYKGAEIREAVKRERQQAIAQQVVNPSL